MTMTISGSGTITGLSAGGLPSASITQANVATPLAGTGPAFSAKADGTQTLSAGVTTKILFANEEFDTNSNFASSRFTPTVAGYYQINSCVGSVFTTGISLASIYKNGAEYKRGVQYQATAAFEVNVSGVVYCNGSTDYIEIYCYNGNGGAVGSGVNTYFDAFLARAA